MVEKINKRKIYIIRLNVNDFTNLVKNNKITGFTYFEKEKPHKIFIKNSKNKKVLRGTIEHELSHIFLREINLRNKINKKEFKKVLKDKNFRDYNKEIYNTKFKLREEYLADLVAYIIFGNRFERNFIKKNYPINNEIVKKEKKKFKPKIISI